MVSIIFLLTIILNTLIGTIPFWGPLFSGIFTGIITEKKDLAVAVAFWGAVIGGALCRIFLNYPRNFWHSYLLNIFGKTVAHYTKTIITGNLFFLVLYFGLTGILGAFIGAFLKNQIKRRR